MRGIASLVELCGKSGSAASSSLLSCQTSKHEPERAQDVLYYARKDKFTRENMFPASNPVRFGQIHSTAPRSALGLAPTFALLHHGHRHHVVQHLLSSLGSLRCTQKLNFNSSPWSLSSILTHHLFRNWRQNFPHRRHPCHAPSPARRIPRRILITSRHVRAFSGNGAPPTCVDSKAVHPIRCGGVILDFRSENVDGGKGNEGRIGKNQGRDERG